MKHLYCGMFSVYTEVPILFVTGLYASGKTSFVRAFANEDLGVCFLGDDIWKEWFYTKERRKELHTFFGQDVMLPDGHPNLPLLRKIFFERPDSAQVRRNIQAEYGIPFAFHLQHKVLEYLVARKETRFVVIESDRAIQACWHHLFTNALVIAVTCPADIRLKRASARSRGRNISKDFHESVMSAQYSDDHFLELAQAVNAISVANNNLPIENVPKIARRILGDLRILPGNSCPF